MIAVVCRSSFLASFISGMLPSEEVVSCQDIHAVEDTIQWLSRLLYEKTVEYVLYEPAFFVDPSPFRTTSPATSFIVLTSPGEENSGTTALACGATALLAKPVDEKTVYGVFHLVSK